MAELNNVIAILKDMGLNVETISCTKNGINLTGLMLDTGTEIRPTTYFELLADDGAPDDVVALRAAKVLRGVSLEDAPVRNGAEMWDILKNIQPNQLEARICGRGNAGKRTLIKPFLDLDIYVIVVIAKDDESVNGLRLTEEIYKRSSLKDIPIEKVFEQAMANSFWRTKDVPINTIIERMIKEAYEKGEMPEEVYEEMLLSLEMTTDDNRMGVLTNAEMCGGAIAIADTVALTKYAEKIGANFYILPSSTSEIILIKDEGIENAAYLKQMVKEVNETVIDPLEKLSDSVYYFNGSDVMKVM